MVICLNGHVCCRGTPSAVKRSPQYRQLFGERAAGSLALYQHHHDHEHGADGHIHPDHLHHDEAEHDHVR
jgi:zinc transport system ATP-binding protein